MSKFITQLARRFTRSLKSRSRPARRQLLRRGLIEMLESRQMLASDFELVKDINSVPSGASSGPGEIVQVGAITFFAASTSSFGRELWKSDGTAAGTVLVKDISDGRASSSPANLTDVNGTLYFNANDDYYNGFELWKSDGTETGTVLVSHIIAGNRDY